MKIPLLTRENQKILKKHEQRIVDLTKEEQNKIIENQDISVEKKLFQFLKENNELKLLLEEKERLYGKELRSGGNYVFEMSSADFEIHENVEVLPDNKIKLGRDRIIDIRAKDKVGKLKKFFRTVQFRAWFVEKEGEYTYEPLDETPIEIKKKNEIQLEIGQASAEAHLGKVLVQDLGTKKKTWEDYIPFIVFGFTMCFCFLALVLWLGNYSLVKG